MKRKISFKTVKGALFLMTLFLMTLFLMVLLNSCASLINKKNVGVEFISNMDSATICLVDSDACRTIPTTLFFPRADSDINLIYKTDSIQIPITLQSELSPAFTYGNLIPFGIDAYIIDLFNPRRFTYTEQVEILWKDSTFEVNKWLFKKPTKGQLSMYFSIPSLNFFLYNNGIKEAQKTGFWGFSSGIDYYLTDQIFTNAELGIIGCLTTPFASAIDYDKQPNHLSSLFTAAQIGLDMDYLQLSMGLQINETRYKELEDGLVIDHYYQANAGYILSVNIKLSDNLCINIKQLNSVVAFNKTYWRREMTEIFSFGYTYKFNPND